MSLLHWCKDSNEFQRKRQSLFFTNSVWNAALRWGFLQNWKSMLCLSGSWAKILQTFQRTSRFPAAFSVSQRCPQKTETGFYRSQTERWLVLWFDRSFTLSRVSDLCRQTYTTPRADTDLDCSQLCDKRKSIVPTYKLSSWVYKPLCVVNCALRFCSSCTDVYTLLTCSLQICV